MCTNIIHTFIHTCILEPSAEHAASPSEREARGFAALRERVVTFVRGGDDADKLDGGGDDEVDMDDAANEDGGDDARKSISTGEFSIIRRWGQHFKLRGRKEQQRPYVNCMMR